MSKVSPLQLILLVVAGFAIVISVLIFSFYRSSSGTSDAPVTMWGTFSHGFAESSIPLNEERSVHIVMICA